MAGVLAVSPAIFSVGVPGIGTAGFCATYTEILFSGFLAGDSLLMFFVMIFRATFGGKVATARAKSTGMKYHIFRLISSGQHLPCTGSTKSDTAVTTYSSPTSGLRVSMFS